MGAGGPVLVLERRLRRARVRARALLRPSAPGARSAGGCSQPLGMSRLVVAHRTPSTGACSPTATSASTRTCPRHPSRNGLATAPFTVSEGASGSIVSTAGDMARYVRHLLGRGPSGFDEMIEGLPGRRGHPLRPGPLDHRPRRPPGRRPLRRAWSGMSPRCCATWTPASASSRSRTAPRAPARSPSTPSTWPAPSARKPICRIRPRDRALDLSAVPRPLRAGHRLRVRHRGRGSSDGTLFEHAPDTYSTDHPRPVRDVRPLRPERRRARRPPHRRRRLVPGCGLRRPDRVPAPDRMGRIPGPLPVAQPVASGCAHHALPGRAREPSSRTTAACRSSQHPTGGFSTNDAGGPAPRAPAGSTAWSTAAHSGSSRRVPALHRADAVPRRSRRGRERAA